jgi:hypothetical protein
MCICPYENPKREWLNSQKGEDVLYRKINIWAFSLLVIITFVLFTSCIINADEADKDPKVAEETTKEKDKTAKVTKVKGQCELFESITIEVDNLPEFLKQAKNNLSNIILYLDGYPLSGLHPRHGGDLGRELIFNLLTIEEDSQTQESWNSLLGRPKLFPPTPRKVSVSVGIENYPPIDTDVRGDNRVDLVTVNNNGFWIYLGMLVAAAVLIVWLAIKSDLLRDAGPQPEGKDDNGRPYRKTFSLGRAQMAFWFFLVIGSYVFIWMVTGVSNILTPSVLTLIGISTATAMSTTIIDGNKRKVAAGELASCAIKKAALEIDPNIGAAEKKVQLEQFDNKIQNLEKTVKPLPSEGFFVDILSDANGISFPRFQIAGWTLVLGVIFIASVHRVLSMPDFDQQLLALMGISSGTYIGFKFPEKQN